MSQEQLDLFDLGDGTRLCVGEVDMTPYHERMASEHDAPYDLRRREVIADWRRRQREGDTAPRWDRWSVFDVTVDGYRVVVTYDPQTFGPNTGLGHVWHADLCGPVTSTGYRSLFWHHGQPGDEPDMVEWFTAAVKQIRAESQAEHRREMRRRKRGAA